MERKELKNGVRGKRTILKYVFKCIVALLVSISTDVRTVLNLIPGSGMTLRSSEKTHQFHNYK